MKNRLWNGQSGNAFLYILIAIGLFAGLTLILSRGQDGGEKSQLDQGTLQINAQRLISYVDQASQSWSRVSNMGTDLDEILFTLPGDGSFNTPPNIHKFFHPDGGGLLYRSMNEAPFRASAGAPVGWYFTLVNADWSPTSGADFIMTYINLSADLCAELNEIVRNNATIPAVTVDYTNTFVDGSAELAEADCAECKQYSSICVQNGGVYAFFNMIQVR